MVTLLLTWSLAEEDEVDDDETLARRLQEQEDALVTRGRATRGALRGAQKPSQAAHKGRDEGKVRASASRGVRSSSRLNPQAAHAQQRPATRGSTGVLLSQLCGFVQACIWHCT